MLGVFACTERPAEHTPVHAVPRRIAPQGSAFDLRTCLGTDSLLAYWNGVPGNVREEGSTVQLVPTDTGWRVGSILSGIDAPAATVAGRVTILADTLLTAARVRVVVKPFPSDPAFDYIIDGRANCDSVWGRRSYSPSNGRPEFMTMLTRVRSVGEVDAVH